VDDDSHPPQPPSLELVIQPSELAGVWANWAQVSHSLHEFTIDFVRIDPIQANRGIVVARVGLSPLMVHQLLDALRQNCKPTQRTQCRRRSGMPDQPQTTTRIDPKVKKLEPERLLMGPRSTPVAAPSDEARRVVGAALAKALKERRT
jgi:hypothetical protein